MGLCQHLPTHPILGRQPSSRRGLGGCNERIEGTSPGWLLVPTTNPRTMLKTRAFESVGEEGRSDAQIRSTLTCLCGLSGLGCRKANHHGPNESGSQENACVVDRTLEETPSLGGGGGGGDNSMFEQFCPAFS